MKVLSVSVNGEPLEGVFDGRLEKKHIVVRHRAPRYVVLTAVTEHEFSIAGGTFHLIGAERKAGTAAAGAIVGGFLAGGAGALAGGALGGGTQTALSIHYPNCILVAEFTTNEFAKLAALGVLPGAQAPGESRVRIGELRVPPVSKLGLTAVFALVALVMCAKASGATQTVTLEQQDQHGVERR